MADISNLKRVQALIRERTSNNKLITILSFLFAFIILLTTFTFSNISYSIKAKVLDYSTIIISSLYSPINTLNNSISNISSIINVHEKNQITNTKGLLLITCYPFNAIRSGTPLRYIVSARKIIKNNNKDQSFS